MLEFIINNLGTIVISAGLLAIIAGVVAYLIINKKKGKSSCGCGYGCSECALKGTCHPEQTPEK